MRNKETKFSHWLWFGVMLSFAPLLCNLWKLYSEQNPTDMLKALEQVISHGELIIICIPILTASIGELFKLGFDKNEFEWFIFGATIFCFFISIYIFTDISSSAALGKHKDFSFVLKSSMIVLATTIFISFSTFMITKYTKFSR